MLEEQNHGDGLLLASEVDTDTTTWWTRFNYKLDEMLFDISKSGSPTIFGAVYRSKLCHAPTGPPNIVIAFRGTMMRRADWQANIMIYLGRLESNPRFTEGLKAVERAVEEVGWERVCVTGHSKGAAIGLLVGRAMAEKGKLIEAHLFNPPHPTPLNGMAFGWIPVLLLPRFCIGTVEVIHEVTSRTWTSITQTEEVVEEERTRFESLRSWRPNLYVHKYDPICAAYITFFEARQNVLPRLRWLMSTPHSIRQSILSILGVYSRPHHLIPHANLVVIRRHNDFSSYLNLREPHRLGQWCHIHLSNKVVVDAHHHGGGGSLDCDTLAIVSHDGVSSYRYDLIQIPNLFQWCQNHLSDLRRLMPFLTEWMETMSSNSRQRLST